MRHAPLLSARALPCSVKPQVSGLLQSKQQLLCLGEASRTRPLFPETFQLWTFSLSKENVMVPNWGWYLELNRNWRLFAGNGNGKKFPNHTLCIIKYLNVIQCGLGCACGPSHYLLLLVFLRFAFLLYFFLSPFSLNYIVGLRLSIFIFIEEGVVCINYLELKQWDDWVLIVLRVKLRLNWSSLQSCC